MSIARSSNLLGKITILLILLSIGSDAVVGKTIHVKVGGTGDGSSWANAYGDLQTALEDADPNDEIWVAEGTYTPGTERWETFMMKEGVGVYGGFPTTGDPGWDKCDPNTYKTILSGDLLSNDDPCTPVEDLLTDPCRADNSMHIMNCSYTDTTTIIGGLTIIGGNANGSKPDNRGGGIYNHGGGVRINNCVFARNTASDIGGALINSKAGAAFINCIFEDNYSDRCGGAIYNGDWFAVYSEISLTNCTFRNNSASENGGALDNSGYTASTIINCIFLENKAGERGGAISSWTGSDLNFTDCIFSANNAVEGGGAVANYSTDPNISKCTFVGNSADKGGGIYNESSDANVSNCLFSNNEASLEGGGMYNLKSDVTVSNCTFNGNSVYGPNTGEGYGGGMSNRDFSSPTVSNCTFNGNSVYGPNTGEGYGGGMSNRDFSSPTVSNCTFIGNSVDGFYFSRGGGMYNYLSNPTVTNCTFSNNSANGLFEGCGGGMTNFIDSVVTNCIFIGNSVDGSFVGYGGGMANFFDSVLTNCIFIGNSATVGGEMGNVDYRGGMRNVSNGGGMAHVVNSVVTNCILSGNSAAVGGGMAHLYNSVVSNCTLSGNLADIEGGGIHVYDGTTEMSCCILWGNVAPNDPQIYGPPTVSYSDIQGGYPGTGNIDTDPYFVQPGYWDVNSLWVDGDYHLLPDSPCIDTGDPNFIADPNATDLDGNPRIVDGNTDGNSVVDMGAYEFFVPPVVVAMRFTPQALNCRSKGNWVKAHLTLPQGFTVEDVDADRPAVLHPFGFESAPLYVFVNKNERVQIEAAFEREAVCSLAGNWPQDLTVAGFLADGNIFLGTSTVRIIHPGMKVIEELATPVR